jgi:isoleucyl-tRNA synthetase
MTKYPEYKKMDFPGLEKEVLEFWEKENIFEKSISSRSEAESFVFYEGPPSANGLPGIHHVISRALKDVFCRYKTLRGYRVERKGGWDTHGLPIELQVEKSMGITKDDIGEKISVADYNEACRKDVLKFKDTWDDLTRKIGYWVDLDHPYITYENDYIETLWYLLKQLHDKGMLYKGHTIQPFSPAAGTGLSSHELNQPGTYKSVKDTTVVAQFKAKISADHPLHQKWASTYFLAWTTTPWTLPSNTALAVGEKIAYVQVNSWNPYTHEKISVVLAKERLSSYFKPELESDDIESYEAGQKKIPWSKVAEFEGKELCGLSYEQLLPWHQPDNGKAFEIIAGDFVTTEDGTGIVHIAPSFGADDFRVAKENGIGSLTLVDRKGRFVDGMEEFSGRFVKNYNGEDENAPEYKSTDVLLAIKLKTENKAFKVEKYEHSYPHCWRTDKPILYYPLKSWFIRTTAVKDRLIELNKTINWKPQHTGEGRFGNWLENLVDWNLSRSRYWGTPLPIWRTQDGEEEKCIGSIKELEEEAEKAVAAGLMPTNPVKQDGFDLHRPWIDEVILLSSQGLPMHREPDLIDVWFDSGAMPYAQWHYPFDNKERIASGQQFPADFIAEGVDQTRGWFFTLHAIAVMLFDQVAYKNVLANGLVLDKNGNKMSKRLGNTVDPFRIIGKYGADATRWYMLSNSNPWDNLKFDEEGLLENQRKLFATLFNVYNFFALYANIDKFSFKEDYIPLKSRPELDQWIISLLNSLVRNCTERMDDYDPTAATRAIQEFVSDHLSNWYVRLCRRRFWKGEYAEDKISAYQTLYECLETLSVLMSSFSPFFSDRLFQDLNSVSKRQDSISVHLAHFPKVNEQAIDKELEERMQMAQDLSSMILGIRKKEQIKVRQPLKRVLVPVVSEADKHQIELIKPIVLSEVNVKEMELITEEDEQVIVKQAKANFKVLGRKAGPKMKMLARAIPELNATELQTLQSTGQIQVVLADGSEFVLEEEDIEITVAEVPGWQMAMQGKLTVALDIQLDDSLIHEGNARELVNRIQNLRKTKGFDLTDRIHVILEPLPIVTSAVEDFNNYICSEILASSLDLSDNQEFSDKIEVNGQEIGIQIEQESTEKSAKL